jgi:hypothetical protein
MQLEKKSGNFDYSRAGERGDIDAMVEIMIDHNIWHLEEIARAIELNKKKNLKVSK